MIEDVSIEKPFTEKQDSILEQLETKVEKGLSSDEAKRRLEHFGPNQLEKRKKKSPWKIILEQVNTPVVYLLAAAAALSFIFGDLPEGIFIVVVLLINTAIGFWMEMQAQKSMNALKEMDKVEAEVLRDGEEQTIDAEHLVPGDILVLDAGQVVAADARLVEVSELQLNESALTGESVPVDKNTEKVEEDAEIAERKNMAFKGTSVTRGKAKAVVTATGMHTEIGNISDIVSSASGEKVPLDKKLNKLSQRLIWVVLGLAAILAGVGFITDRDTYTIIQTAIAWAIAAIPEGLPIVASIALARGMIRLARHEVIVKQLSAVEALGETNTIFTDKTGTLTENRLTVNTLYLDEEKILLEWEGDEQVKMEQEENELIRKLFTISVLCNNAEYDPEGEESEGDPLEIALLKFARAYDQERLEELRSWERVAEDPFNSETKMMGTIYQSDKGYFTAGKGAAKALLEECSHILKDDESQELSEDDKQEWLEKFDELAKDGLRSLAFAYKESDQKPQGAEDEDFLHELTFVGLIGFIDPPQGDVKDAIETCKKAGIEVVMVTGDHPETAKKIAQEVSLVENDEPKALRGKELDESEESKDLSDVQVFSRVSPEQKLTLIEKYQEQSKIVAMTGDGVNDAPALKKADIGIAMGMRGTQVAKEVADMVLKDDSFPSIVRAIREGRIIFSNIRKFIIYQLSYHLSEIIIIAASTFAIAKLSLLPLQLLFLNILTDVFPALAIGIGEGRSGVMDNPPKDPEEPIINKKSWQTIILFGSILALGVSAAFFYAYYVWDQSFEVANNVAFFSLAVAELLHTLNMRDPEEPVFKNQITRNKYVWMAVALCATVLAVAYSIPYVRDLLSLQPMEARNWILIALGSIIPVVIIQIIKSATKKF
ncbi:Ca2+-transporting ATPase [Catalinimonas alkaloidigena]|uniref:cation-translocating P-type ATPase n=1 Tax=Catalinimonas alkaloidigena TaxID=1075417 RepID=UPI00240656DB|nr:cation-transporting P-type ATPase [Catalinimonas alkaloidigena]MDF9797642.1 Ca2+-transporting ATPase [Catalinimonas alkaloidigena]